jgi:CrcB protein
VRDILLIGFAGAFGALGRYGVTAWTVRRFGSGFPYGTLCVNVAGSLLLGVVLGLSLSGRLPREARLAVGVGFLGAFTTFSTFSCDTIGMLERGANGSALINVAANLVVGLVAASIGFATARMLAPAS